MTPQHQATSPTPDVPRWTIDVVGDPCWGAGQCLSRFDLTGAWNTAAGVPAAHRALVQCVRDADTLRKARQLAARHADSHLDLDVGSPLADLVDLLTEGNPDGH